MNSTDIKKTGNLIRDLIRLPFVNPRGFREVLGVARVQAENVIDPECDVSSIDAITIEKLIAELGVSVPLNIHAFPQETHSIALIEAIALAVLMKKAGTMRAFEFGTHRGVSTSQLASNLPDGGEVITLDLPRTDRRTQFVIDNPGDMEVSQMSQKADLIPSELRAKVRFLEQDSAKFDENQFAGQMDFVFVDGAHTAEYVRNDSEKAWTMLREGGVVAWHDCRPQTPDVVRYLRHCPFSPKRVVGGTIAFAIK